MNWKEILLNLGTPVVETLIAEEFDKITIFQRDEDGKFIVLESKGIVPKNAVYESEDEIREEFPDMILVEVSRNVYYLLKEVPESMDVFKRIEELSEKIRSIEALENRITRHVYQLEGLDTVISSLLEPIPTDILLSMVMDAVSELFVTSVALYRLVDGEYVLFTSFGSEDFPDELPGSLSDATKYSGITEAKDVLDSKGILIPISEEAKNVYILYLMRGEPFTPEEKALLESIAKIISRTREYVKGKQTIMELDRLLNQARFVVESLGEFAQKILSVESVSELEGMIADMLREMLQVKWLGLYRKNSDYELAEMVKVEDVELPDVLKIENDFEGFIKNVRDFVPDAPKLSWMGVRFSPEGVGDYLILLGPPITEEIILGDIFELYIGIILNTVSRAFESIKLYEELKDRERKIRRLYESLKEIEEFVDRLNGLSDPGEVYQMLFDFSRKFGIGGMRVDVGGMKMDMGETRGVSYTVDLSVGGRKLGRVEYYKGSEFDDTDRTVLRALTKGVLSVLRTIYLMSPGRNFIWSEEIILRFLREKAVLHGMNEENLRFYLVRGADPDSLNFGVGVITEDGVLLATEREREDLEKLGLKVEEV